MGAGFEAFGRILTSHFIGIKNRPMIIQTIRKSLKYVFITGLFGAIFIAIFKNMIPKLFFSGDQQSEVIMSNCLYVAILHVPVYISISLIIALFW